MGRAEKSRYVGLCIKPPQELSHLVDAGSADGKQPRGQEGAWLLRKDSLRLTVQ